MTINSTTLALGGGKYWDLNAPRVEDVDFQEIAFALAHLNRFTGRAGAYSVAQHCCLVSDYLLRLGYAEAFYGLLHDAHEAFIGDIPTPAKAGSMLVIDWWRGLADKQDRVIFQAAGLSERFLEQAYDDIKRVDRRVLATELRDLLGYQDDDISREKPLDIEITRWCSAQAEAEWFSRFDRLQKIAPKTAGEVINPYGSGPTPIERRAGR